MATKRIISSRELWKKISEGELKEIIEFASKRKNELDVQIRDNYLNVYSLIFYPVKQYRLPFTKNSRHCSGNILL